jgi:hypothetical protein
MVGNEIIDGGYATFSMQATGSSATGRVLSTSDPSAVPLGPFTMRLDQTKDVMYASLPLLSSSLLCGPQAEALPVAQQQSEGINCGA